MGQYRAMDSVAIHLLSPPVGGLSPLAQIVYASCRTCSLRPKRCVPIVASIPRPQGGCLSQSHSVTPGHRGRTPATTDSTTAGNGDPLSGTVLGFPLGSGDAERGVVVTFAPDSARFESSRSFGIDVTGDLGQHRSVDAWYAGQGRMAQSRAEIENGADRVNETDPQRVFDLRLCRRRHQRANDIPGRQPRHDLPANAVGAVTSQHIG